MEKHQVHSEHGSRDPRLLLLIERGGDGVVTRSGVEQTHRSPMTMAGEDLLVLSHGYLGAVVRRRA